MGSKNKIITKPAIQGKVLKQESSKELLAQTNWDDVSESYTK
jgi:hypothetical protein